MLQKCTQRLIDGAGGGIAEREDALQKIEATLQKWNWHLKNGRNVARMKETLQKWKRRDPKTDARLQKWMHCCKNGSDIAKMEEMLQKWKWYCKNESGRAKIE